MHGKSERSADALGGTARSPHGARTLSRAAGMLLILGMVGCTTEGGPDATVEGPTAAPSTPAPQFRLDASNTHSRFSSTIPPALTVPSGGVVEVLTKEASDGQITSTSAAADLVNLRFDPIHPLTGPVFVESAEPGDVLAVTLHEIEVTGWGWATILPGFGFLADEFTEPYLKGFELGPDSMFATFNDRIRIPLAPFPGVMAVAPATDSSLVTIPPRANGGNMDNRHLVAGTKVYFPVLVRGALFSIGDTHAAQGDGEISGTAIEAPMRIVYQVDVIKGGRPIPEPQYETPEDYAVTAFGTTIDEAAKKAARYMVDYLSVEHGLTREEAYVLASLTADLKISEVVDVPHVLVSMHIPKAVLGMP